jgi:hypothetical protein
MGLLRTIDAYCFVIGILQPVLAFVLFALSYNFPEHYEFEEIQRHFGPSGSVSVLVVGHGASWGFADIGLAIYRFISSLLISVYLCPALSVAHRLPLRRGVVAILTVALFFLGLNIVAEAVIEAPGPSEIAMFVARWLSKVTGAALY